MRKAPELRFAGFDGEWEEKKLSTIAKFSKGKGYSKNDISNGKYPIYLYGQMYTNYKSQINEVETYTDSIKVNSILSKGNEVVIPSSGETAEDLARASHMNISNVLLGGDLNIIEPNDGVNSHFLALELSNGSVKRSLSKKAQGKSVVHLYNSDIKNQKINYTKFEEQEKIGDLFKKIDDLIEIQEGKVAKMEDFKKSMLQKMFPKKDELVPDFRFDGFDGELNSFRINELIEYSNGNTLEPLITENGDLEVLNLNSVSINGQLKGTSKYISSPYPTLEKNDIIMILSDIAHGNLIGKTAVIPESNKYVLNQRVAQLKPKNIDSYFLSYYINHNQKDLYALSAGTSQLNLSKTEILKYYVRIPALEEQEKIGQLFKNLDTQIENEEKLLDSYKMMKKSLLQKMFV